MKAKLFANGGSQAVRLPAAFRFEGSEVEIDRDPVSGAVILRPLRPSWRTWMIQRDAQFQLLKPLLPRLAPAVADPWQGSIPVSRPQAGEVLLLDPVALGRLLVGQDPELDAALEQGRCAIAAIHALEIERVLAALQEPQITALVQGALDLCVSLPWTAACSRALVAMEQSRTPGKGEDTPLQALLRAQAQVTGAVLVSEL